MKKRLVSAILKKSIIICALLAVMALSSCDDPEARPGDSFDGSVQWALQIAQPEINNFSSDAQIYSILGATIWKDGRLPANTGTWSFISWSASLQKICQVTVDDEGNTRKTIRDSENPPNTGSGSTLPAGWVNSPTIFSAIPTQEITRSFAQLVAFNYTSYLQAPNEAVWGINFAGGRNPLVRWNGEYIGTQSD